MKLRIKGDSLRLRVGPSEVQRLMNSGRVEETIHFSPGVHLTYALEHSETASSITASHSGDELAIIVPTGVAHAWAGSDENGIYAAVPNGFGTLQVTIEKDLACLNLDHATNLDTYPNPKATC